MCGSRKYSYSPHRRDWNFLWGGGFCKTKKFKEMYETCLEFPEGWGEGFFLKSLLWGRYGYFLELHNEKNHMITVLINNIDMKKFMLRKCWKIFLEIFFFHSRKLICKFLQKILCDINGLGNFLLSFSQS